MANKEFDDTGSNHDNIPDSADKTDRSSNHGNMTESCDKSNQVHMTETADKKGNHGNQTESDNHNNTTEVGPHDNITESGNHDNMAEDDDRRSNHDNRGDRRSREGCLWTCCEVIKQKMSIVDADATPVNWKMIGLVFVSLFASSFSLTFLFPFLPEMVVFFGYREEDKGYYAGLVASGVFAGRACGSYFWGWLSDKYGRRPIVLMTVFGNGLFSLIFGFTVNLPMAFATRFLTGLANGTVGTAKTILYEISDNTNQAVGMSILAMSWGAGVILGPTIGGLLASPTRKYPELFHADGLFGQFPYLLPSMFVGGACFIVVVIDFFLLPETKAKKKDITIVVSEDEMKAINSTNHCEKYAPAEKVSLISKKDHRDGMISMSVEDLNVDSDIGTYEVQVMRSREDLHRRRTFSDSHYNGASKGARNSPNTKGSLPNIVQASSQQSSYVKGSMPNFVLHIEDESAKVNTSHVGNGHAERMTDGKDHDKSQEVSTNDQRDVEGKEKSVGIIAKMKKTSLCTLFSIREVRQSVMLYTVFSFAVIGFEEIFTVWASTEISFAGLGFDASEIGMALGITAVPMLLLNFYIFPFLARRFDLKKTFIAATILNGFVVTAVPALHLLHGNKTALWAVLMILTIPQKIFNSCCFSATSLFVNNSSPKHLAGAVNGIAMTATALARTAAPAVGGSVFAWSIGYGSSNIGPPFDVNLSFFLFGFILWLTGIYSIFLPESLNKQKT